MLTELATVETTSKRGEVISPLLDASPPRVVSAADFTFAELVALYNQARTDYIVPMPMNAARLREYVNAYDIDLRASAVAQEDDRPVGLAMLGVRGPRSWITRLGILPTRRRSGAGQLLMEHLLANSQQLGVQVVQLEVIQNNHPAHRMFRKLGFTETRELLVLRRPPGRPESPTQPYTATHLGPEEAAAYLTQRRGFPSWLDETPSLHNAGHLLALRVTLESGAWGWLVYRQTIFQLGSLVLQTEQGDPAEVGQALLHALHTRHPALDTKSENLPAADPHVAALYTLGYIETFRRIEMHLAL